MSYSLLNPTCFFKDTSIVSNTKFFQVSAVEYNKQSNMETEKKINNKQSDMETEKKIEDNKEDV